MKKIATFFAVLPLAATAFGQAITITAADVPLPGIIHSIDLSAAPLANPATGSNQAWNYGALTSTTTFTNVYVAENLPFFTSAGVDVFYAAFKTLSKSTGLGYNYYSEIDFNTANIKESGIDITQQLADLSTFTGSTLDSFNIPAQQQLFSTPSIIMSFPFTANSSWSSVSRRFMDFVLTVGAASIDHVPGQCVTYFHRKDTIVGWGKLTVHTPSGPSIPYDVLMDKIMRWSVDSFYLAGAPGPTSLLTSFGLAQDQVTDSNCRYNFYRKGSFSYLYSLYYGSDNSFTTPLGQYQLSDSLIGLGVDDMDAASFTTVLFPNPSAGDAINLVVSGKDVQDAKYYVTDMAGRMVQSGALAMQHGQARVVFSNALVSGQYMISVVNGANNKLFSDQFTVAR